MFQTTNQYWDLSYSREIILLSCWCLSHCPFCFVVILQNNLPGPGNVRIRPPNPDPSRNPRLVIFAQTPTRLCRSLPSLEDFRVATS